MTLEALMLEHDLSISIYVHKGMFFAKFPYAEVLAGGSEPGSRPVLVSNYGQGSTMKQALEDYVQKICGKSLVLTPSRNGVERISVPKNLRA